MTRRVHIELVRRELRLSITRLAAAAPEARAAAREGSDVPAGGPETAECPSCASPWLALPACGSKERAAIQRAFGMRGVHTRLSLSGELLVCGRSFELQVSSSSDRTNSVSDEASRTEGDGPGSE